MKQKLFIVLFVVLADQISKLWAINEGSGYVWPFLNVVLARNTGITFGLLPGISLWFLWFAMGIIVSYVMWELAQAKTNVNKLSYGFILGGAIGNLIDRARFGYVIDFIDVHLGGYHYPWPFNIADSFIVCGIFLLLLSSYKKK